MLKIGDKPETFSLDRYDGGGTAAFNDAFFTGKTTVLSFIDITDGWDWTYYLLKLRALFAASDVKIVMVFFEHNAVISASNINAKFPFPVGSGSERRFTKGELTPADPAAAGLYTVIDTNHAWADEYLLGIRLLL